MANYRRFVNQVDRLAETDEPFVGDASAPSETVWPYDYRRSYVPSRPSYGVYPQRTPYGTEVPRRSYEYEEYVAIPETPRIYDPLTDDQIRDQIYDRLDHDVRVPGHAEIQVHVMNGVVTLTGSVRNRRVKQLIGMHAWQQPGVEDVHNNVNIAGRWRASQAPTP